MTSIPPHQLGDILEEQIKALSKTLGRGTVDGYRTYTRIFLRYLNRNFPELQTPAQLQRDPHILGWLRSLEQRTPPYAQRNTRANHYPCAPFAK